MLKIEDIKVYPERSYSQITPEGNSRVVLLHVLIDNCIESKGKSNVRSTYYNYMIGKKDYREIFTSLIVLLRVIFYGSSHLI